MKATALQQTIRDGGYDAVFAGLYGKGRVETQRARYARLLDGFLAVYGDREAALFSVPGRTEVSGNHTDHQHGRVLAAAVDIDIIAAASPTDEGVVRLKSEGYPEDVTDIRRPDAKACRRGTSSALIAGVCAAFEAAGRKTGGFCAYTMSDVLTGSGLSSSAAFEVMLGNILSHFYNEGRVPAVELAKSGKYAENEFFGKPCGLMDQAACAVGGFAYMDFASAAEPEIEKLSLELGGRMLCIVNTGGNHADLTNEYALVPKEMKEVAAFFGKEFLRDVDEQEFYDKIGEVRKEAGDRAVLRAMHFFDDDRLAAQEAQALRAGDFDGFKEMVIASGRSSFQRLQNVFATINPQEQGLSLALALTEKFLAGEGAWRVHGGGFAGTIQAYVPLARLDKYRAAMEKVFGKGACYVLSVRQAGGTKVEL